MKQERKTFRLGIAMAGAVSAGAYTAGVMDYLLESLQRWQEKKDLNHKLGPAHADYDPSIPMHDVVIDVIGGASAGGMTAAIAALSLTQGVDTKEWDFNKKKLYDTWVNLNDHAEPLSTLEQMLTTGDIDSKGEVPSLLNSYPIDQIADRALPQGPQDKLPPYIADDLEIILTITSLRGIPIAVNFFDTIKKQDAASTTQKKELPAHKMYLHKGVAHFRMGDGNPETWYPSPLRPGNEFDQKLLLECAKATGAFPIGLKARKLEGIQLPYIKSMIKRMFGLDKQEHASGIEIQSDSNPFDLVAVDGGTINNEPFGEIITALEEKSVDKGDDYAVIMIDPFPNFDRDAKSNEDIHHPDNIIDVIPNLLGAIRRQAMVKEQDILRGLSSDYSRKMIFPKREGDPYPIACGSLDGFGGFFDRSFREHDYMLGRRNCQRFLRKHLSIPLDKAKKSELFKDWKQDGSDARHNRFFVQKNENDPEDGAYPIIPDLGIESMKKGLFYDPYELEPEKPRISPEKIFALKEQIERRLEKVIFYIFKTDRETVDHYAPETRAAVRTLMDQHFKKSKTGSGFRRRLTAFLWRRASRYLAKRLTKMVIGEILLDFKKRDLLDD